jgi:tight adherence protein C
MGDLFSGENLIIVMAFVSAFAAVMAIAAPFMRRDQKSMRMSAVANRRDELSRQQKTSLTQQQARWRPSKHANVFRAILSQFNLENLASSAGVRQRLVMAGFRSQSAIVTYVFIRLATSILLAFMILVLLSVQQRYGLTLIQQLIYSGAAGVIGFYFPQIIVGNIIKRRQKDMSKAFPDALDLLTICVEAGASLEAAFARVTDEVVESSSYLAQEFGLTSAELAFLGDRNKAYFNFAERTGMPSVRALATTLSQAETYGTPVSVALRVLSQESRDDRMARAEKKAASLPAQLTVPMIVFFLPPLFVVIMGPAVMSIMKL